MTIKEAIYFRHTVRKYLDKPLGPSVVENLNKRIQEANEKYGVQIKLVTNDNGAIWSMMRMFVAKNVKNYLVLAGPDRPDLETDLGFAGADIALYAQTLGLNSWWIGETYRGRHVRQDGIVTKGVIIVGYGMEQGKPHKSKTIEAVSQYDGDAPEWFTEGVIAALCAPTAMNRQNFMITGKNRAVHIEYAKSRWSRIDLGIVKYHFEMGAGKENFNWI